jgi:hypothetical protein
MSYENLNQSLSGLGGGGFTFNLSTPSTRLDYITGSSSSFLNIVSFQSPTYQMQIDLGVLQPKFINDTINLSHAVTKLNFVTNENLNYVDVRDGATNESVGHIPIYDPVTKVIQTVAQANTPVTQNQGTTPDNKVTPPVTPPAPAPQTITAENKPPVKPIWFWIGGVVLAGLIVLSIKTK